MGRTKGSTNKKNSVEKADSTEPKKRGRKSGQKVEREPAVLVELTKDYRIKMDKYNFTLQEKCKAKEKLEEVDITPDGEEDAGWKNLAYHSPSQAGLLSICNRLIRELTLKKAPKGEVISLTQYQELLSKSVDKVMKLFPSFDSIITKYKG